MAKTDPANTGALPPRKAASSVGGAVLADASPTGELPVDGELSVGESPVCVSPVDDASHAGEFPIDIWPAGVLSRADFVDLVWRRGREYYRDLPWRNLDDPYAVLVSEVMLQQTQVPRVLNYWQRFMGRFPSVDALAAAAVSDVLEAWQGLGYNRRALALKRACDMCSAQHGGVLPETVDELVQLPGIGPATAAGVVAFALQKPAVYIETNVRTVFIHELFPGEDKVSDRVLEPLVADTCSASDPRGWYYALLDYGAALKAALRKVGENPSRRSSSYSRQSEFEGSRRQKRSWVVRRVLAEDDGVSMSRVRADLNAFEAEQGRDALDPALFESIIADLVAEGFFSRCGAPNGDDTLVP